MAAGRTAATAVLFDMKRGVAMPGVKNQHYVPRFISDLLLMIQVIFML